MRGSGSCRLRLIWSACVLLVTAWVFGPLPGADGQATAGPRRAQRRPGFDAGRLPLSELLRPLPEDQGPLTDAERRALLRLLRLHAPQLHRDLIRLQRRDPAAFAQRFEEAAPRLRQLRRLCARDPALARSVLRHAENLQRLRRARAAWAASAERPQLRRRIQAQVRRLIARNLRIEAAVLDDRLRQLSEQRQERIDAWLARLEADELERAAEPPAVRELVARWLATESDEERAALTARLRRIAGDRLDREVNRLSRRLERLRKDAETEVDRRFEQWLRQAEAGGTARPSGPESQAGSRPRPERRP